MRKTKLIVLGLSAFFLGLILTVWLLAEAFNNAFISSSVLSVIFFVIVIGFVLGIIAARIQVSQLYIGACYSFPLLLWTITLGFLTPFGIGGTVLMFSFVKCGGWLAISILKNS
ncbi:MAG TPA: hypothetical protein VL527_10885 [Dongiaceae bacterium]|nr:hypothetical protein [Dongiaceae bacterium]